MYRFNVYDLSGSASIRKIVGRTNDGHGTKILQPQTFYKNYVMIKQDLLDIIACPKCKGPVRLNDEKSGLVCDTCRLVYEIRDDIPIMLIDEATPLDQDQTS